MSGPGEFSRVESNYVSSMTLSVSLCQLSATIGCPILASSNRQSFRFGTDYILSRDYLCPPPFSLWTASIPTLTSWVRTWLRIIHCIISDVFTIQWPFDHLLTLNLSTSRGILSFRSFPQFEGVASQLLSVDQLAAHYWATRPRDILKAANSTPGGALPSIPLSFNLAIILPPEPKYLRFLGFRRDLEKRFHSDLLLV